MALLFSAHGEESHTSELVLEAGQGVADITIGNHASTTAVRVNLDKLDYPFFLPANSTTKVYAGGFLAYTTTSGTTAEAPDNDGVLQAGESDDLSSGTDNIQYANGAAIISYTYQETGEDEVSEDIYVRLNKLNFPFNANAHGSNITAQDIKVLGENSVVAISS